VLFHLLIRREKGSMEDVVDVPGGGKAESISDVGNLGDYLERSVSPWGKLGCHVTWKF
jgi:hypothetical protein